MVKPGLGRLLFGFLVVFGWVLDLVGETTCIVNQLYR